MTQLIEQQRNYQQDSRQVDTGFQANQTTPACEGKTELFFSERTQDMRTAQMICTTCLIRDPCLQSAREQPPFAGVWAGVIFVNGEEQLLKRGRGRPRKTEQLDNARILKTLASASKNGDVDQPSDSGQEHARQIA